MDIRVGGARGDIDMDTGMDTIGDIIMDTGMDTIRG